MGLSRGVHACPGSAENFDALKVTTEQRARRSLELPCGVDRSGFRSKAVLETPVIDAGLEGVAWFVSRADPFRLSPAAGNLRLQANSTPVEFPNEHSSWLL